MTHVLFKNVKTMLRGRRIQDNAKQCYLLCGLSFTRFMERAAGIETSTTNQTFNKACLLQIYNNTKEMSQRLVQE